MVSSRSVHDTRPVVSNPPQLPHFANNLESRKDLVVSGLQLNRVGIDRLASQFEAPPEIVKVRKVSTIPRQ